MSVCLLNAKSTSSVVDERQVFLPQARQHLSSDHISTRAQRTRVHICPNHGLLCHSDLYYFEFFSGFYSKLKARADEN
jgi:hypothetical protein